METYLMLNYPGLQEGMQKALLNIKYRFEDMNCRSKSSSFEMKNYKI